MGYGKNEETLIGNAQFCSNHKLTTSIVDDPL